MTNQLTLKPVPEHGLCYICGDESPNDVGKMTLGNHKTMPGNNKMMHCNHYLHPAITI